MIITALTIFTYSILTIFTLFILGYGLVQLFIPEKLKPISFWLIPWFSMLFLIFSLVISGLLGFSVKQSSPFLIVCLLILDIFAFFKRKYRLEINPVREIIIAAFIILSIIFNTRPLITRVKSLTTISLGNNDVIAYAVVPDYLVDHSIGKNLNSKTASSMITENYRWGSPIIISFFLNLYHLRAYQYVYLFEAILFALTIPLIYLLFKILYKDSFLGLLLCLSLFAFNVNLLYILYHDFLGQIFFWGIEIFLLILLFSYLTKKEIKSKDFLKYDFIIGLTSSVLMFSYHETAIFIAAPLFLFFILRLIIRADINYYFRSFIRIFFITFSTSFISIMNAIKIDFAQAFMADPNQPIGWQLFREKIPFANPYEALSFYSIHSFDPLPTIIAVILSLLIVLIFIKGISKSREKPVLISFLIIYFFFYYWMGIYQHNFFAYNRALTYSLPLIIIVFTIGFLEIFLENKYIKKTIGILILLFSIVLVIYSAKKLSNRFVDEYLAVSKDYQSLAYIQNNKKIINESLYIENNIDPTIHYWNSLWISYFLNLNKFPISPASLKKNQKEVRENSLVLVHKSQGFTNALRIILKDIIWENNYFKIGRLCKSDTCLLESKENLSMFYFGKNNLEDSLLLSGWSTKEPESRWTIGKKASLRLVVKDDIKSKIVIEALALNTPQTINISIDGGAVGTISLSKEFKQYQLDLVNPLFQGVHLISFTFSYTYKPSEISQSNDNRDLAVNFKKIGLE